MKHMHLSALRLRLSRCILPGLALLFCASQSMAQGSLTNCNNTFTENFDGMGSTLTLPTAFRIRTQGATTNYWTAGNTTVNAAPSSGSPTTGNSYNWGVTGGSDRSIGAMSSSSFASPNHLVLNLNNDGTSDITGFTVSYNAKRFRMNATAASIQFFYSTNNGNSWLPVTGLDLGATNFPTGANTYFFSAPQVSNAPATSFAATVPAGSNVLFRWTLNTGSTNSQGIGIDDISVLATYAPAGSIALNSATPAVPANSLNIPSANNVVYAFSANFINAPQTVQQISFVTQGNYQSADLTANPFKLWYNTTNSVTGATQIGTAQPSTSAGSGETITFSNINQNTAATATGYYFLTADVNPTATPARTIQVTQPSGQWFTTCPYQSPATGSAVGAGGVQTIGLPASITITNVSPAGPYCQGDTVFVTYSVSGSISGNNTFTAQIASDAGFTSNLAAIGSTQGTGSGLIVGVIPANQPSTGQANYRIRVQSSVPQASSNSSALFAINESPVITLPSGNVCNNAVITGITASPATSSLGSLTPATAGNMTYNATSQQYTFTPSPVYSGPVQWTYTWNGCSAKANIQVNSASGTNISDNFCKGTTYAFNGQNITTGGIYTAMLLSSAGCDSLVTLNLTMDSVVTPVITVNNNVLSVAAGQAAYQWLQNGTPINGATSYTYSPVINGLHSVVVVGSNGCTETSAPFNFMFSMNVPTMPEADRAAVYPNPATSTARIQVASGNWQYWLTDVTGAVLAAGSCSKDGYSLDVSKLPTGLYVLHLQESNGYQQHLPLLKQ